MDYNRSNNYEMNYMNPATGQSAYPQTNSNTNYGFQYTPTPPGGNPPKYEDVIGGPASPYPRQQGMTPGEPTVIVQPIPVTSVSLGPNSASQRRRKACIWGLVIFSLLLTTVSLILRFVILASY